MFVLVLDDQPERFDGLEKFADATFVCSSEGMIDVLERYRDNKKHIDELWLDHDLGGRGTGMHVAQWLAEQAFHDERPDVDNIMVHSMNVSASMSMVQMLDRWNYNVTIAPVHTIQNER